jgi:hypothetical protein
MQLKEDKFYVLRCGAIVTPAKLRTEIFNDEPAVLLEGKTQTKIWAIIETARIPVLAFQHYFDVLGEVSHKLLLTSRDYQGDTTFRDSF